MLHKELFPEDDTECCDGTNAYNKASRKMVAKAMLTAKSRKIRRQYGYFLMGHRLHSKIYIRGFISVLTLSKMGVRQGDPYAGFGYSLGQMNMLDTMCEELGDKVRNVIITCVVDDVKIQGPVEQRALVHNWLRTRAKQWGYVLNTQPGKNIVISGLRRAKSDGSTTELSTIEVKRNKKNPPSIPETGLPF